jgi:hypothetical protein
MEGLVFIDAAIQIDHKEFNTKEHEDTYKGSQRKNDRQLRKTDTSS